MLKRSKQNAVYGNETNWTRIWEKFQREPLLEITQIFIPIQILHCNHSSTNLNQKFSTIQNKIGYKIERNYRKFHCLESQSQSTDDHFYPKSALQLFNLILGTTHFEEIKAVRSVLVTKQIGHKRTHYFYPKSTLHELIYESQPQIFTIKTNRDMRLTKITGRTTVRIELYLESQSQSIDLSFQSKISIANHSI